MLWNDLHFSHLSIGWLVPTLLISNRKSSCTPSYDQNWTIAKYFLGQVSANTMAVEKINS